MDNLRRFEEAQDGLKEYIKAYDKKYIQKML